MLLGFSFVIRLLLIFAVTFSLVGLSGLTQNNFHLPTIQLAKGNPQPCPVKGASGSCSENWIPAGPSMDAELAVIFTDQTAEFTSLQSASPSIDFTDWPLTPDLIPSLTASPNFLVSSPISSHDYFEIQFMLANNFWGTNMNFGNDPNGVQIRQGIAHLIDRASFATNEPAIAGTASAIDNPLPLSNGGLPSPNPCAWDSSFQETSGCVVGAPGGTAYHLATATGLGCTIGQPTVHCNFPWQQGFGSSDFCAAAQHLINAGLATGKDSNCVLTGISPLVTQHTVSFFIRSDDPPRLDLGDSLAQEICALFGQGFITNCPPYLQTTEGPITAFPGFTTSTTGVNLNWGMYTAGYRAVYPFDSSLYFTYNSRFVSATPSIVSPTGPCTSNAVPTFSAGNYMYLCNPSYDTLGTQMEFSPCPNVAGDPSPGSTSNGPGANCLGTSQLSAVSAGIQAEDTFGKSAYTIPVYVVSVQYGYLSNWTRAINDDGLGIPNPFTWLNTYSATPAQPGTVRQGFKQSTGSLSPYVASSVWDFYIIGNVYDSLNVLNPLNSGQLLDWMTVSSAQLSNSALTYTPPPGTVSSFRFTLRSDMYWHDGRKVTPWDVKFSYLTLLKTGAFQGGVLVPVSGVTVLGPSQFDVNLNAVGPFTKQSLTSPTVIPGRYWSTCSGSIWDGYVLANRVPDICIQVDPNKLTASFDPLANGVLVGSGPWVCKSSTGLLGSKCSSSGVMNPAPGGSYTLQRFGKGLAPASSITSLYFRSAGNLALYVWSQDTGDIIHDFLNFSVVAACFGKPAEALGSASACGHFQQGIGANGGPVSVGLNQVAIVNRFVGLNWVAPFNWVGVAPPTGIAALPPVLVEGGLTLNPSSIVGCSAAYPTGGYNC